MKYRVLSGFDYETKDSEGNTDEKHRWNTGSILDTDSIPGTGNPPLAVEWLLEKGCIIPIYTGI